MSIQIAASFVDAINSHNTNNIAALMADNYVFIDSYGNSTGKEAMELGWADYFLWFPDYLIEIDDMLVSGDTVVLLGYASGTYRGRVTCDNKNYFRIPAAWRMCAEHGAVKVWQVYADSKLPFDIINAGQK